MAKNNDIPKYAQIIIAVHKAVAGDAVSHAGRLKSSRYFVWQEDFIDCDSVADNTHDARAVSGSTDLYTKREFDTWVKAIEQEFEKSPHILWKESGMDYEEDTGFWHFTWDWTVI